MSEPPSRERPLFPASTGEFFRSRWVARPEGAKQLDPAELTPGFRAGAVACGLKGSGETDVGVMACDEEAVVSALLLTQNASAAAPIRICRDHCDGGSVRAVVVNSGNANAATGARGIEDALSMQARAAAELGVPPRRVAIAETGTIGVPLPVSAVLDGIPKACSTLSAAGGEQFARAIMTTDRAPKQCTVSCRGVTVSAQAKGAGMIEPGFATMLCFVQTDALLDDPDATLRSAVSASFERITVDGQMSTNDTVLLQATGATGRPLPVGLLEAVLLQLALEVVADGEGATRVVPGRGPRRGGPPRGRAGGPGDRKLAARQDVPVRTGPQLGPDLAGRGPGARGGGDRRAGPGPDRRRGPRR